MDGGGGEDSRLILAEAPSSSPTNQREHSNSLEPQRNTAGSLVRVDPTMSPVCSTSELVLPTESGVLSFAPWEAAFGRTPALGHPSKAKVSLLVLCLSCGGAGCASEPDMVRLVPTFSSTSDPSRQKGQRAEGLTFQISVWGATLSG